MLYLNANECFSKKKKKLLRGQKQITLRFCTAKWKSVVFSYVIPNITVFIARLTCSTKTCLLKLVGSDWKKKKNNWVVRKYRKNIFYALPRCFGVIYVRVYLPISRKNYVLPVGTCTFYLSLAYSGFERCINTINLFLSAHLNQKTRVLRILCCFHST